MRSTVKCQNATKSNSNIVARAHWLIYECVEYNYYTSDYTIIHCPFTYDLYANILFFNEIFYYKLVSDEIKIKHFKYFGKFSALIKLLKFRIYPFKTVRSIL